MGIVQLRPREAADGLSVDGRAAARSRDRTALRRPRAHSTRAGVGGEGRGPEGLLPQDGGPRIPRGPRAGEVRRGGHGLRLVHAPRGRAEPGVLVGSDDGLGSNLPQRDLAHVVRIGGAESGVARAPRERSKVRGVGAHGTGGGKRRGQPPDDRAPREGRMGPQRPEAVHFEREHRGLRPGVRERARHERPRRDFAVHGSEGGPGVQSHPHRDHDEARATRKPNGRPRLRELPHPEGPPDWNKRGRVEPGHAGA